MPCAKGRALVSPAAALNGQGVQHHCRQRMAILILTAFTLPLALDASHTPTHECVLAPLLQIRFCGKKARCPVAAKRLLSLARTSLSVSEGIGGLLFGLQGDYRTLQWWSAGGLPNAPVVVCRGITERSSGWCRDTHTS